MLRLDGCASTPPPAAAAPGDLSDTVRHDKGLGIARVAQWLAGLELYSLADDFSLLAEHFEPAGDEATLLTHARAVEQAVLRFACTTACWPTSAAR